MVPKGNHIPLDICIVYSKSWSEKRIFLHLMVDFTPVLVQEYKFLICRETSR